MFSELSRFLSCSFLFCCSLLASYSLLFSLLRFAEDSEMLRLKYPSDVRLALLVRFNYMLIQHFFYQKSYLVAAV